MQQRHGDDFNAISLNFWRSLSLRLDRNGREHEKKERAAWLPEPPGLDDDRVRAL